MSRKQNGGANNLFYFQLIFKLSIKTKVSDNLFYIRASAKNKQCFNSVFFTIETEFSCKKCKMASGYSLCKGWSWL